MKNDIIILLVTLILGGFLGFAIPKYLLNTHPKVTTISKEIKVPIYLTKYITKQIQLNGTTTNQIVVTTTNCINAVKDLQWDVTMFETSLLNITPNLNSNRLNLDIELHRLKWNVNVEIPSVQDYGIGFNYNVVNGPEVTLTKHLFEIMNIPVNIGLAYSFRS